MLDCHDMVWGEGGASGVAPPSREQSAWAYDAKVNSYSFMFDQHLRWRIRIPPARKQRLAEMAVCPPHTSCSDLDHVHLQSARIVMFGGWADEWLNDLVALDVSGVVGPPYSMQSLDPAQGPVTGGTMVSIRGSDFVKPPEGVEVLVKFVGESGEEVVTGTYVNHGEVTCHAPSWEHHISGSGEVH